MFVVDCLFFVAKIRGLGVLSTVGSMIRNPHTCLQCEFFFIDTGLRKSLSYSKYGLYSSQVLPLQKAA